MSGVARTNRPGATAQATRQQLDELDALLKRMLDLPVNKSEPEDDYPPAEPTLPPLTRPASPPPALVRPSAPQAAPRPEPSRRAYPPSYMVVETSTPPLTEPPAESGLGPRQVDRTEEVFEDYRAAESSPLADDASGDWVPLRSSWQPSAQTWKPLAESWQQANATAPPPPPEPPRAWTPPPAAAAPLAIPPTPPHTVGQPVIPPPPSALTQNVPAPPSTPIALLPAVWFNKAFDVCLLPLGPIGKWLQGGAGRGFLGTLGILAMMAAAALAAAEGFGWPR